MPWGLPIGLKRRLISFLHTIDELSWGFEYKEKFQLKKGIAFKLGCAGHILGSCFIRFELPDGFTIVFSGDLGAKNTPNWVSASLKLFAVNSVN